MNQKQRLDWLLEYLIAEHNERVSIPDTYNEKRALMRALVNIRPPKPISEGFIEIQDSFLREESQHKGIVKLTDIPGDGQIKLWQGDITCLAVDGIVNAANSEMLGCFVPGHSCIDNAIHTAAGVQLRQECYNLMQKQGHPEETGSAKITGGYNLPAKHVIHTVGPVVQGKLTDNHKKQLSECYTACLDIAVQNKLGSVAFCCISTGVFGFPKQPAAEIATNTVKNWLQNTKCGMEVIFNVFTDEDCWIYSELLKN